MAVLIKRSSVAGKVPTTASMNLGELAMNTNDGRLFMMANNGSGNQIVEITSVTSLLNKTVTASVTLTALEYSNAMLVFSGVLTGNTVVTVPNTPHSFIVVNKTTGNYSLTIQATGQTPSVNIVQGAAESLLCDTTGVYATASTTGVEFAKIVPVTGNVTTDITYAGAVLIVTTSGVTITLGNANSYPAGAGFGILNLSNGNITVAGNGTDTSELGLPLTVKPKDSYYLASNNASQWNCIWYSNPFSPTFQSAIVTNNLSAGSLTVVGASNLNGGLNVTGTTEHNGNVDISNGGTFTITNTTNNVVTSIEGGAYAGGASIEAYNVGNTVKKNILLAGWGGRVLIGGTTDDGASPLQVNGDIVSSTGKLMATRNGQTGTLRLRSTNGTSSSPTLTPTATQISTIVSSGFDGTNFQDGASVDAWSEGAYSNTSAPTNIRFYTAPSGSINKSERMRITAGGQVLIGQTSNDGSSALQVTGAGTFSTTVNASGNITSGATVQGQAAQGAIIATNGSGAGQTSMFLYRAGAPTDQKKWEVMHGSDGSFGLRTVNDAYSSAQYAIQITRGSSYNLGYMELMPTGGHVVIGSQTDDGVNELQVNGTIKSATGFVFPDGTTQTTANGVTAPTSTLYTPANAVSTWGIGSYNVGFVQVFKNNERLVPVVDFQATDGANLTVTVPATGRDRYEVLTSVIYSPSVVFAPTSYTTSLTAGVSLITTNYNVGCVWLFKNNMKLLPVDFTATNGATITLTNASDSSTDVYEVVTFQPFAVSGMLPLTGGTMTGALTVGAVIQSTTGGFKFPDGSVQTSAASGSGSSVPNIPAANASTAYTLALTDAPQANGYQGILQFSSASAVTVTVPLNATVAFPVGTSITFVQNGAGQITVSPAAGATVNTASTRVTRTTYSAIQITKLATDTWLLTGDMS